MVDASSTRSRRPGNGRSFTCTYPDCGKVYTRSEHLTRHELNHRPKEIFLCSINGCHRKFVRQDLKNRHEERHRTGCLLPASPVSFVGNTRADGFSFSGRDSGLFGNGLTPEVPQVPLPPQASIDELGTVGMSLDNGFMDSGGDASSFIPSFGTWLFNADDSVNELDFAHLPFSNFENSFNPASDFGSPRSGAFSVDKHNGPVSQDFTTNSVQDVRLNELSDLIKTFIGKERKPLSVQLATFIGVTDVNDTPIISADLILACVGAFWEYISPQMPFVHQPTFSPNTCNLLLLATIVILGSSTIHRLASSNVNTEYADFADLLARHVRWELFTDPAASVPAELWVQQALLLLELYEKMFSSRELHERAHIHHASTLALLRRGNPLVGRSGSESPPNEMALNAIMPTSGDHSALGLVASGSSSLSLTWWGRWARAEAQNRVVFAAYLLDCSHSIFFSHAAVLSPHEILLPYLPVDDILWHASDAEAFQRAERNLRMYGVKPISFLDGLKRTVHGEEVKTHPWGRKILMYGLISVGHHISNKEPLLTSFDPAQDTMEQERCRKLLVEAFDTWKTCFDDATWNEDTLTGITKKSMKSKKSFDDPHTIYFLANLSMHSNIGDLQSIAGSTPSSARRLTPRDRASALARVKDWSKSSAGQHATSHAFRFLHTVLVVLQSGRSINDMPSSSLPYECRKDELNYRPWVIYLAALTVWAYTFAADMKSTTRVSRNDAAAQRREVVEFLTLFAESPSVAQQRPPLEPLLGLLEMLYLGFADAQSHVHREARDGLKRCCEMLVGPPEVD
jgi:hypothetical protein